MGSSVPNSAEVYYQDRYWNDHPVATQRLRQLISAGHEQTPLWCIDHFLQNYINGKPAKRALFLNCGNGWVERMFIDEGIVESGVAFDYSKQLLADAERQREGRNIEYFQADCNTVWFPENSFDLVVNLAAMHHVQWIDRMHRVLVRSLKPDGLYFNFDYVGPHRNQYGPELFAEMQRINRMIPKGFRAEPLNHPHLETMLAVDPTEAIHSELILLLFNRYFYCLERKDLYGGFAYQIMHNNHELFLHEIELAGKSVAFLMDADELAGATGATPPLFSYFVGRPKKIVFDETHAEKLNYFADEEIVRERKASELGGKYYDL